MVQTTGAAKPRGSAPPPPPPPVDAEMTEANKKRKANAASEQLSKKAEVSKKKD